MVAKSECTEVREPIVSFVISHGYNDYKYSLCEEHGEVLLCAYYQNQYSSYKTVDLSDVTVSREDMEELGKLCDKYLTDANLENNDASNDSNITVGVEIVWESGKRFQAAIALWEINDNKTELVFIAQILSFFDGLCKQFDECYYEVPARPFAEGNIVSFIYSEGIGGNEPTSYGLRYDLGELLFDADTYINGFNTNDKAVGCEAVQLRDEQLPNDTMNKFNSLCEELNLREQQIQSASVTKSYIDPPWNESPDVFDVRRYLAIGSAGEAGAPPSFTATWDNKVNFTMDTLPDSMAEALREFFQSLVANIRSKPEEKAPKGKVVSVRLSRIDTSKIEREGGAIPEDNLNSRYGYCFHLWEEDGEFNFDGYCLFKDLYNGNLMDRKLKLEKTAAAQEDMESLRKICEKNSFSEKWYSSSAKKIENKNLAFGRQGDIGRDRLEVIWENGARLDMRLYYEDEYIASYALKSYFVNLAERLDKTLPASGNVVSFRLKGEYSSQYEGEPRFIQDMFSPVISKVAMPMTQGMSPQPGTQLGKNQAPSRKDAGYLLRYEYHMREVDGEVLFSAYESDHPSISNRSKSITESTSTIENTHFEKLRALCEKHAFAEEIQTYHTQRWEHFYMSDSHPTDTRLNPNYDFFEIVWENGAHCDGVKLSREFQDFFTETVNNVFPRDINTSNTSSWTCVCGHTENEGKFCSECGRPMPPHIK
jgi:hypothetical protein